jgi:hypothetical protein
VRFEVRDGGEHTVAGVKADDEARLLLDFLRHLGGRDVVDGCGSFAHEEYWLSELVCAPRSSNNANWST